MLINYFKVGIRSILKYKVFSFITIFGLALAMSITMLIILMWADQIRYDDFHSKKDRIYRILSNYSGSRQAYATSAFPLATSLKADYPIIEEAVNLTPGITGDLTFQQNLAEVKGYFTDPAFFKTFSFELTSSDELTALTRPNSIILSKEVATRLFRNEDPIGKTVEFADRQLPIREGFAGQNSIPWGSYTITGVIDLSTVKSNLEFDVLISSASREILITEKKVDDLTNNWEWYFQTYTYVLLHEGKSVDGLELALNDLVVRKYAGLTSDQVKGFTLQPQKLSDIALGIAGNDTNNRLPLIGYFIFGILAVVIMGSACFNYINLAIARSLTRAKEIGVRKVTGASRRNLIIQFLSESIITSLLAMVLAILMLVLLVPAFKGLWVNQFLKFELPAMPWLYLVFIGFSLIIGVIAGLYPAMYLSTYKPIKVLKNLNTIAPGKLTLRKILGVAQLVISLFFITTSILIYNQFKHYISFDYGFQSDNIVNIELQGIDYQKLTTELQRVPGVSTISACNIIPSTGTNNNNELRKSGSDGDFSQTGVLIANEKFTDNLGIELIAGKLLPAEGELSDRFILVNEAAVKAWGYRTPDELVGAVFETKWGNENLEVIGVVKDFRYKLLVNEHEIKPLMIRNQPKEFKYVNVKLSTNDLMATVSQLEAQWKKVDPLHPFKYEFYDAQLQSTHQPIFDLVAILGFVAFLAVVIACLGMLGMATYLVERKTREVGIRKVLGASVWSIVLMLSKGFYRMLLISILIGAPLSYFINTLWLEKFPNRVDFGFGTVLAGTIILLILGLLTIVSQTLRAARGNPAETLKME